ncbi:MAG: hypothetical protein AAB772_01300 [Patescibacteria group bacterium]
MTSKNFNNKEKEITIDDLAIIINKGFEENKLDISELKNEVSELKYDINERLDSVENILMDYKPRIEKSEDSIKELQSDFRQLLGMKKRV